MVRTALGLLLYATVLVLFASWATAHVLLCFQLASPLGARALFGLFFPPLAPYYANRMGFRKLGLWWTGSLAAYLLALGLAVFL